MNTRKPLPLPLSSQCWLLQVFGGWACEIEAKIPQLWPEKAVPTELAISPMQISHGSLFLFGYQQQLAL